MPAGTIGGMNVHPSVRFHDAGILEKGYDENKAGFLNVISMLPSYHATYYNPRRRLDHVIAYLISYESGYPISLPFYPMNIFLQLLLMMSTIFEDFSVFQVQHR